MSVTLKEVKKKCKSCLKNNDLGNDLLGKSYYVL